ncbi:uncharacterized protein LOC135829448 [Sycon ciliatum]|uniref:uncharacterized protein LOC135829448 n=1 Tax=Sycon ciliatum TaxID=27933 RepID=UPI0031F6EC1D
MLSQLDTKWLFKTGRGMSWPTGLRQRADCTVIGNASPFLGCRAWSALGRVPRTCTTTLLLLLLLLLILLVIPCEAGAVPTQVNVTVPCTLHVQCPRAGDPACATSCCGEYGCCTTGAQSTLLSTQHRLSGQCANDTGLQYSECRRLIVQCVNSGLPLDSCAKDACFPKDNAECCYVEDVAMTDCFTFFLAHPPVHVVCVPQSCIASQQLDIYMEDWNGLYCAISGHPDVLHSCPISSVQSFCVDDSFSSCSLVQSTKCTARYGHESLAPNTDRCNWTLANATSVTMPTDHSGNSTNDENSTVSGDPSGIPSSQAPTDRLASSTGKDSYLGFYVGP